MSAKPTSAQWMLDAHSRGKHQVLQRYLNAWTRILGASTAEPLVVIDGFAGPGRYASGEDGSPVLCARVLVAACALPAWTSPVMLLCFEPHEDRAQQLRTRLTAICAPVARKLRAEVYEAEFAPAMQQLIGTTSDGLPPIFAMVDPFGLNQVPMQSLRAVIQAPRGEVFVSFMASWGCRFVAQPEMAAPLTQSFGDERWRACIGLPFSARVREMLRLYELALRDAGAKHVVRFDLYNGKSYKYSIFHTSNHERGCSKMKEAIWNTLGGYAYIGGSSPPQMTLDFTPPPQERLAADLLREFAGRSVRIQALDRWIEGDRTMFYRGQLRGALKWLEQGGRIRVSVHDAEPRRAGTFPEARAIEIQFPTP